ncbi:MAG: acyl-CoA dehydrogenase [Sphingobium sp.]|nr:acyl-CoA dehydrogenase [Sphingobium sp.]
MPIYHPPVKDTRFFLDHVLDLNRYAALPVFAPASPDIVTAILEEGARFAADVVFPLNQSGDAQGCTRHADGRVTTPDGFAEAYRQFTEAGWTTLHAPEEYGGQAMPAVIFTAFSEYVISANQSFAMYHGLTGGAVEALLAKGSAEQKALYLPKMVSGVWAGTMNLTESQCGTDLGLIKTKAVPNGDGSYAITGTKIFISAGEHDLTENIIHLVLARTPDAPEGSKGISLFIVPKFMPDDAGEVGERNAVSCGSIEHKMGIHGNSTCVMNYDGATGWLVGEENKGLSIMFIMMNAARLGVGLQGLAQAEIAYQNAAAYAADRRQGRALTGAQEPQEKADTLYAHPDVRRMLMEGKALTEGLRGLMLWGGLLADLAQHADDEKDRQQAEDLVSLLTPVIKGYGTDKGFDVAVASQQVLGGHGYIREQGMEQYVRDARIAQIYEGTNGVQAMDLVGRKLPQNMGRAVQAFFAIVAEDIAAAKGDERLTSLADALEKANGQLQAATMWLMHNAMTHPNQAGAAAHSYMHIMGIVSVGLMWLRMAKAATVLLDAGDEDSAWLEAKLVTARFYAERIMPDAGALRRKIEGGAEALMALPPEMFANR